MQYGWHEEDGNAYYLGTEDEGWRAESKWLWLEKSGNNENDLDDDDDLEVVLDCSEDDNCDDEVGTGSSLLVKHIMTQARRKSTANTICSTSTVRCCTSGLMVRLLNRFQRTA